MGCHGSYLVDFALDLVLHLFVFDLEALDHLLAEVGSLGQFLLYLLVNSDVSVERVDLLLHLVVLRQQLFSLLRLVLQLNRQLRVL